MVFPVIEVRSPGEILIKLVEEPVSRDGRPIWDPKTTQQADDLALTLLGAGCLVSEGETPTAPRTYRSSLPGGKWKTVVGSPGPRGFNERD